MTGTWYHCSAKDPTVSLLVNQHPQYPEPHKEPRCDKTNLPGARSYVIVSCSPGANQVAMFLQPTGGPAPHSCSKIIVTNVTNISRAERWRRWPAKWQPQWQRGRTVKYKWERPLSEMSCGKQSPASSASTVTHVLRHLLLWRLVLPPLLTLYDKVGF